MTGILVRFPPQVARQLQLSPGPGGVCRVSAIQLAGQLTLYTGSLIDPSQAADELQAWVLAQAATQGLLAAHRDGRQLAWETGLAALALEAKDLSAEQARLWLCSMLFAYLRQRGELGYARQDAYGWGKFLRRRDVLRLAELPDARISPDRWGWRPSLGAAAMEFYIAVQGLDEHSVPDTSPTESFQVLIVKE